MARRQTSLSRLRDVFENNIAVREIAMPLVSFDEDTSGAHCASVMKSRGFDVIGVRRGGLAWGSDVRDKIGRAPVGESATQLRKADVIAEDESMLRALEVLANRRWLFASMMGHPNAIATRANLASPIVGL